MRLRQLVVSIFILTTFAFFAHSMYKIITSRSLQDLQAYYFVAQDIRTNSNPYLDNSHTSTWPPLFYPPSAFIFLTPLAFFSSQQSIAVWTMGSLFSLLLSIFLLTRLLYKKFSWIFFCLLACLAFLSFPFKFTLGMGQINLYVFLFSLLAFWLFVRHHPIWSGTFLGVAIALKLFPVIFFLFFLRKKAFLPCVVATFVFFLSHVPMILEYGNQMVIQYYLHHLPLFSLTSTGNAAYYNQSLNSLLIRMHIGSPFLTLIQVVASLLIWGISFFSMKTQMKDLTNKQLVREWSLLSAALLITMGVVWQHYFVFELPAFALLLFEIVKMNMQKKNQCGLMVLGVVAYFLISANIAHPDYHFPFDFLVYSHVLLGSILLFVYLVLLNKKESVTISPIIQKEVE